MNQTLLEQLKPTAVTMVKPIEEAEADEMWSFVQSKKRQRWLWHAIDHQTGQVLAYVLADHKDQALVELKALLEPFSLQRQQMRFRSRPHQGLSRIKFH